MQRTFSKWKGELENDPVFFFLLGKSFLQLDLMFFLQLGKRSVQLMCIYVAESLNMIFIHFKTLNRFKRKILACETKIVNFFRKVGFTIVFTRKKPQFIVKKRGVFVIIFFVGFTFASHAFYDKIIFFLFALVFYRSDIITKI